MKKLFTLIMAILMVCIFCACTTDSATKYDDSSIVDNSISNIEENQIKNEDICKHTVTSLKNRTDASCTEDGYSGDKYCVSCDKIIETGYTVPAIGHDTEIRNKKDATADSTGYTGDTYCKKCDTKTKSGEVIPKTKINTTQQTNSNTVYITATGKKYHSRKSCPGLSNAKAIYDSTLSAAKGNGLTACSKCH